MVPFYCSSCVAGAIFRSLHHFRDDDSLCPPSAVLPLLSLALSLRMDHVFILLVSPTGLWVGFFYSLLVSAAESDVRKDVMAPRNVTLKGNRSLWCCFPCLPFLKESGTGWRLCVFSFFSWEALMRGWPCHDNTMSWFWCLSSEVGRTRSIMAVTLNPASCASMAGSAAGYAFCTSLSPLPACPKRFKVLRSMEIASWCRCS